MLPEYHIPGQNRKNSFVRYRPIRRWPFLPTASPFLNNAAAEAITLGSHGPCVRTALFLSWYRFHGSDVIRHALIQKYVDCGSRDNRSAGSGFTIYRRVLQTEKWKRHKMEDYESTNDVDKATRYRSTPCRTIYHLLKIHPSISAYV